MTRKSKKTTPEEDFREMVEKHDPTYLWSKDPRHIETEARRKREIDRARKILGDQISVPIWNQAIRRKIVPSFLDEHLWRVNHE